MKTSSIRSASMRRYSSRLDAPFYLNDAVSYYSGLKKCPYELTSVADESSHVFFGNIFSRNFVKDAEHGIPYLRASEILKADLASGGLYLSKTQATKLPHLRLKRGWILVTCSGSLGNCALADARFEQFIATHDLIRIVPEKNKLESGVLYAFLASRYGYATLTHSQYGSVILHTNPDQVGRIQIPVFTSRFQKRVHEQIVDAARLREEADAALKRAVSKFENESGLNGLDQGCVTSRIGIQAIVRKSRRLDSLYQIWTNKLDRDITDSHQEAIPISKIAELFLCQRGQRVYIRNGIPFLSTAEMGLFNAVRNADCISKHTVGISDMIVNEDDLLVSCDGTTGNVIIVGHDMAGIAVSHGALRIRVDEKQLSPYYVFCFLRTKFAQSYMRASSYGSVIQHINDKLVGKMKIPILPRKSYSQIVSLISDYKDKLAKAADLENEAIDAVEAEIESWQGE